ncbi:MAG: YaiI/YqxD family protein [Coriobacteriia bacterium]
MTTLYIDADACPVTREAVSVARRAKVPVVLVGGEAQAMTRWEGRRGVECVTVASGRDAADFEIVRRMEPGDVVVTADIGLAAMALGKGAAAVSPRGRVFTQVGIAAELEVRHAQQKHRRQGGRTKGPRPFTDEDRERFAEALAHLLGVAD